MFHERSIRENKVINLMISFKPVQLLIISGWKPVRRGVDIKFDLENGPLEIQTDSTIGSGDDIRLYFLSMNGARAGGLYIQFVSVIRYHIVRCKTSYNQIEKSCPGSDGGHKIWRVTLKKAADIRLLIHCNNMKTIDVVISSGICGRSEWNTYWSRSSDMIRYQTDDTASDFYRKGPGE